MSFFAPSAAWWFLLVLPLVVFYFLKLKRPRRVVPSLLLWRRVLNDERVNAPFQRFKRNILLLLQLACLMLLVLAAMQPFFRGSDERVRRLPVLIDCSASMAAATERGGATRLEEAKARVEELIEGLLPDQELALISYAKEARQRCGFTNDRGRLREALEAIEVEEVPSEMEHALRMTGALRRGAPFDEILVVTDGNVPGRVDMELPFRVTFERLQASKSNIGLTACAARWNQEGEWEIFLEVRASQGGDYGGAVTMTEEATGERLASELVTTGSAEGARVLFRLSGNERRQLRFDLIPNTDFDALASDNVVFLTLPLLRPVRVWVPEHLQAFRHALRSVPYTETFGESTPDSPERFDLLITDDEEHAAVAAKMQFWLGRVPPPLQSFVEIESPSSHQAIDWRRDEPLLEHVDFSNVVFLDEPVAPGVRDAVGGAPGFEVLLWGARGPLLLREDDLVSDRRVYHALFHPDRSTFPYRVGFPVFVANLVDQARLHAGLAEARALAAGWLSGVPRGAEGANQVRLPSGDVRPLEERGVEAKVVGWYRYEGGGAGEVSVGVNLLSPEETALAVVDEVQFREASVATGESRRAGVRPLWRWLALGALACLLAEWWFFQRRHRGGASRRWTS